MKEFLFKHPIISLLLASTAADLVNKTIRTVAYAITGREGLAPNQLKVNINKNNEEEETDGNTGDIQ